MKLSLDILDWRALAPGIDSCEDWIQWVHRADIHKFSGEIAKSQHFP